MLKQKLKIHEDKVENIKTTIYDAGTRTNNVSAHLHAATNNSARRLALESIDMAKNISDEMRHELQKARRMHEEILKLREKFAILEPDWEIKLGRAEENISLTKTNIRLANISLSYVEEQAQKEKAKFDEWNNTMSSQVQELRDKIAKARHAAEGVSCDAKRSTKYILTHPHLLYRSKSHWNHGIRNAHAPTYPPLMGSPPQTP